MYDLMVACALFLLLHLGVSGTCLRDEIVHKTGEKAYLAGFSACVLASLIWIVLSYPQAYHCEANTFYFVTPEWYRALSVPVIGFAFLLGLPGMMMKNPTSVLQDGAKLQGVTRITRHPFLWGATLWAACHLIGSDNVASSVIFLTILILSFGGTFSIDAKCRRRLGEAEWQKLAAVSCNLPFLAMLQGRTGGTFRGFFREYGLIRLGVTVLLFCLLLVVHFWLFGVLPMPAAWTPLWIPGL